MHLLLAGSMIATVSAWAVTPAVDVFDTGLAGHFAAALHRADQDCLATSLIVDGGSMLVILDERGGVTEVDLGMMPPKAERELRAAMPALFAGAMTAISPDAMMCAALGAADEEHEVEVRVDVATGGGTIVIEHNGERREMKIDFDDIGFREIAAEMDEAGIDMHALIGRLMSGDEHPEMKVEMVIELDDEDGKRTGRRIHFGGDDDGAMPEHMMMMFIGDQEGQWVPDRGPREAPGRGGMRRPGMGDGNGCPMCGRGGDRPRGMGSRGAMQGPRGMPGRGGIHGRHGVSAGFGDMDRDMLRQDMYFHADMGDDPEVAWDIIESLPPEMRRAHDEWLRQLMGDDDDGREYFERTGQFDEKIAMARQVASRLADTESMAVFGVWQAREHLDPEARIAMLAPMVNNESLLRSVRNAAAFVVMEALGDIGDDAGAAETLREMILSNGAME
jgi:hypothetical protein